MNLTNRLASHFAAAAAVAALAASAEAQVTRSPFVAQVIPNNIDGLYINVETGLVGTASLSVAGWDINPYSATGLQWFHATGAATMRFPGAATGVAGNLNYSTSVDATGSFSTSQSAVVVGAAPGNWRVNGSNYFGFRFQAAAGTTHYGWGRFAVGALINGADRRIEEIYYEATPNAPIVIGSYGSACGGLGFAQSGQPNVGQSFDHTVSNIPVTSGLGVRILGAGTVNAGVDLGFLGWPGCFLYNDLATSVLDVGLPTGGSFVLPFSIPNAPALVGFQLNAQGAALGIDGGGALTAITSKGIASVIGL
jgi:hypothetical protein